MKLLVAIPRGAIRDSFFPPEVSARLKALGEAVWNDGNDNWTEADLADRLPGVDVLLTGWGSPCLTEEALKRADRLRVLAHTGGSVAGYAGEAAYNRGIRVLSGNELYARSVAECVAAYALYLLRDIGKYSGQLRTMGWSQPGWRNEGLLDQKVGLIGFGAVARHTARLLSAFGAELYIWADHVSVEEAARYGAKKASLEELLSTCKISSIHLARTPETFHLIDREKLRLIPDGAILINTARGAIVDEAALAEALAGGRFRAALDVYEVEPLPMDSPLRQLDNVLLMPHMGGPTLDRRPFVTRALIDALPDALAGRETPLDVTREMMRRMTR